MRKGFKYLCMLVAIISLMFTLVSCSYKSEITLSDLNLCITPDNTIPSLTGDKSEQLLDNIDRGFRLETYYTLGSGRAWPADEDSNGYDMLDEECNFYKEDKAVEIQVYIYLTEYSTKPLDDFALNQMKDYFEYIRSLGMSMLLRFAYDYEQPSNVSTSQDIMLKHIEQIKRFNMSNENLIKDTVTAYQFGMIGAWGEWGSSNVKYDQKKILNALIDAFPKGTYFQGRYMRVVNQTDKNPLSEYVGYHNDFLIGRPHPWNTAADKYKSKDYKKFFANAPYRLNDGEMPWGGYTDEPNELVDGISFLKQMREHSMDTLSIKHNYKEERTGKDGVVRSEHNIARWKTEYITEDVLKANKLPYYPSWFENSSGGKIQRSIYEYLRDYLGYVLMMDNLQIKKANGNSEISFSITNYGLGTPLTLKNMEIVVCDIQNGMPDTSSAKSYYLSSFDPKKLTTYNGQKITFNLPQDITNKAVGIKISRGNYSIKTSNDLIYLDGINFIPVN